MTDRKHVISVLEALRKEIRVHGVSRYGLILSVAHFVNSVFCDCKYVEYWIFDMDFGRNECHTEMGAELRGLDTIEKFVDFLFTKYSAK